MATTVDSLIVEIRAETANLRKGLNQVNKQLDISNKRASTSILKFGNLAKVFAAGAFLQVGKSIVNTARSFEDLEATLVAVTQSTENAEAAMSTVTEFTKTTPFQLKNVTEAFTRFYQAGITPTAENLTAFGNVAAANNKDITQLANAVFNATTGEMEMLKQFGIKAKQHGDDITMIFEGQETTFKNTSANISQYLLDMGNTRFEGAIDARLKTLSGSMSNLADNAALFANDIGESGLTAALVGVTAEMQNLFKTSGEGGLADALGFLASIVGNTLIVALKVLNVAIMSIVHIFKIWLTYIDFVAIAFLDLAKGFVGPINFILEKFGTFINKFVDMYNELPEWMRGEPMTKVSWEIDTQKIDGAIEKIRTRIKTRLNDKNFFGGSFGDGVTGVDTPNNEDKGGSIVPKAAQNAKDAATGIKKSMEDLQPVIMETTNAFATDFVGSLMEGENAMDSFENLFKNMVKQIIAAAMQMMVIKPIMDAIFGAMGFSTGTTGGSAGGGTLQANRPMLVGERGPEIFVPNTGGTLMNNMNSNNAMGGGGVTVVQNNNFALGVGATARAEVQKMLPQIAETSKMAVFEAAARGGAYRKGLLGGT